MKEMSKGLERGDLLSACVRLFLQQTNKNNNDNNGFAEDCETVLFLFWWLCHVLEPRKPGVGWMGLEFSITCCTYCLAD
jgi:hypothetical protein